MMNEDRYSKYDYLWLESGKLYQEIFSHPEGSLSYLQAEAAYLRKLVQWDDHTGSVNSKTNRASLEAKIGEITKMALTARLEEARTPENGRYIDWFLSFVQQGKTTSELDGILERHQGKDPDDQGLQELTDILIRYMGETERF